MPKTGPFDAYAEQYERWFDEHRSAYVSELLALRALVPWEGRGLEIGVGTGRFAVPLGLSVGLDPSRAMLRLAAARGLETAVAGVAEELPFPDASFDHALLVTTLCFVDSPERALAEAHRVLRSNGTLVIGFIDRQTPLGQAYLARRAESLFYRDATFYSALEVGALLEATGFGARVWGQTLVRSPSDPSDIEPLRRGTGRGGFAVVLAARTDVPADRGPRFG